MLAALLCAAPLQGAQAANNIQYRYDAVGRLISITDDDGITIAYSYDANGNVTKQVTSVGPAGSMPPPAG